MIYKGEKWFDFKWVIQIIFIINIPLGIVWWFIERPQELHFQEAFNQLGYHYEPTYPFFVLGFNILIFIVLLFGFIWTSHQFDWETDAVLEQDKLILIHKGKKEIIELNSVTEIGYFYMSRSIAPNQGIEIKTPTKKLRWFVKNHAGFFKEIITILKDRAELISIKDRNFFGHYFLAHFQIVAKK